MKETTLKIVKGLAKTAIESSKNTMCISFLYQPKMPDQVRKDIK